MLLGGVPYALHIIPGINGLTKGIFIQQATAFSILFMAPLGIFLSAFVGLPLAMYLAQKDLDAGFDEGYGEYNDKSIIESKPRARSRSSSKHDQDHDVELDNNEHEGRSRAKTIEDILVSYQTSLGKDGDGFKQNQEMDAIMEVIMQRRNSITHGPPEVQVKFAEIIDVELTSHDKDDIENNELDNIENNEQV